MEYLESLTLNAYWYRRCVHGFTTHTVQPPLRHRVRMGQVSAKYEYYMLTYCSVRVSHHEMPFSLGLENGLD